MKDDPERLTTEFMVKITGCPCEIYSHKKDNGTNESE